MARTPDKEDTMHRRHHLTLGLVGLLLLGGVSQSWGGPPNPTPSDPIGNTASGTSALGHLTNAVQNTASGVNALFSNTTGNDNTASGAQALHSNATGYGNTAVGHSALLNSTRSRNTAVGLNAGRDLLSGEHNI